MYKIFFYRDKNGNQQVLEYLKDLSRKNDKKSRIKLKKIQYYVKLLSEYGLGLQEPYIKRLDGDIWELRPLKDRILFVRCSDNVFVLLHQFEKTTRKTPPREIQKAKKEFADLKERGDEYD